MAVRKEDEQFGLYIDDSELVKIDELSKKYKETWGKEVDDTILPQGMTQDKMVKCLEWMIETNDSLLVAYYKLYR